MVEKTTQNEIERYSAQIINNPTEEAYSSRARAYLKSGELQSALSDYISAEQLRNETLPKDRIDSYLKLIGCIFWMLEKREDAARTWSRILTDIKNRKIAYSDPGGGILSAALLWFADVHLKTGNYRDASIAFMQERIKRQDAKIWPRPIAHFLIGNIDERDLRESARSSPPLTPRRLSQACFYISAKALLNNDHSIHQRELEKSVQAGSENPIENEYLLAEFEFRKLQS